MNEHEKINYVEFPAKDIEATKAFFSTVFGWSFIDYGPEYTAFSNEGIDGGFFKSDLYKIGFIKKRGMIQTYVTGALIMELFTRVFGPLLQILRF